MNRGDAVTGIRLARDAADRWDELVETGAAEHRRDIDTAVRHAREAGLSLAEIARAGGWSRSRAQQLVARATKTTLGDLAVEHAALGSMEEADRKSGVGDTTKEEK